MKLGIVYIYPPGDKYTDYALRFVASYNEHPPAVAHDSIVVLNGRRLTAEIQCLFSSLPKVKFLEHDNSGKDIGGYFKAAREFPCDLMVCIGSPARPRMAGWLLALVIAHQNNGPGIYAPWGFHHPSLHLRTTVFAITPKLLNAYPHQVSDARRYAFEHGPDCIAIWCMKKGFKALQVTSRGVFDEPNWYYVPNSESYWDDQHSNP